MKAHEYAEAIYLAAQGKDEPTLDRLVTRILAVVDMHGHRALLPAIVRELAEVYRKHERAMTGVVRVARPGDVDTYADRIAADATALGVSGTSCAVACDASLIGGYEVRTRDSRIDRTYKRALVELYATLSNRS